MIENKIHAVNTRKRKREIEEQSIFQPFIEPITITVIELQQHKNFISNERYLQTTHEDLSER